MELTEIVEPIVSVVEMTGVGLIVLGLALALLVFAVDTSRSRAFDGPYEDLRRNMARSILLGLEVLVAGDIIRTVAVDPTLESVAVLAGIVVIRTFLSMTLQVEATGRWPWQQERGERATAAG